MLYKFEYTDNDSRDLIVSENTDKVLIEEQNTIDGNFLIFTDKPGGIEERIEAIEITQDLILLKLEGVIV